MSITDPTPGEMLVKRLISQLPIDEFSCYVEPRIDQEGRTSRYPDFLIVWRKKGVLALEVKDWHEIEPEESNQDVIRVVKIGGGKKSYTNPIRTAKGYACNIIDLLEKRKELLSRYNGIEQLSFPCEGIVMLPYIDGNTIGGLEQSGIFPRNRVFSRDALLKVDTFRKLLDLVQWTWQIKADLSDEVVEIIQHSIKLVEVNSKPDQLSDDASSKIGDLTLKQENIVFAPLPVRDGGVAIDLIRGSVGSGKTIVLTRRADNLIDIRPNLKILVTAFNIDLTNDLRARIENKNIKVMKFFDICKEILEEKWPMAVEYRDEIGPAILGNWVKQNKELIEGQHLEIDHVIEEMVRRKDISLITEEQYRKDLKDRNIGFSEMQISAISAMYDLYCDYQENLCANGEISADYEDVPDLTLQALFGHKYERYFDVIMIDEAQDWAPKWIRIIKRLLKPGGYLMLCDDPAQSLWKFFNWEQRGIKTPNKIDLELPQRTTQQIMDVAQCLFDIDERLHTDYDMDVYPVRTDHLPQGNKPTLCQYRGIESEFNGINKKIEAILASGIHGRQIGILCSSFDLSKQWKAQPIIKENNIYVGHFNLMKGLEFHTVIIPDLDDTFSEILSVDVWFSISTLRKLFVAMTRARKGLILSTINEIPGKFRPLLHYVNTEQE